MLPHLVARIYYWVAISKGEDWKSVHFELIQRTSKIHHLLQMKKYVGHQQCLGGYSNPRYHRSWILCCGHCTSHITNELDHPDLFRDKVQYPLKKLHLKSREHKRWHYFFDHFTHCTCKQCKSSPKLKITTG